MAQRRMFSRQITESDAFADMPPTAQLLYFHLGMEADDDGIVNNVHRLQRSIGSSPDDLKVLVAKRFLILFDDGLVAIKHWRVNNYIQADRYHSTTYRDHMAELTCDEENVYHLADPDEALGQGGPVSTLDTGRIQSGYTGEPGNVPSTRCIQSVSRMDTQARLGKASQEQELGEGKGAGGTAPRPKRERFSPPTAEDVAAYARDTGRTVDAERFVDFYASKGWKVGKSPMRDWRAAVRNWASRDGPRGQPRTDARAFAEYD